MFVLIDSPNADVIAYYTLSSYAVEVTELGEDFVKRLPRYPLLPATLLGRLAVNGNYQGKRLGELILVDALKKALDATVQVASLTVVAEALDNKAVNFYQKYGFQQFKRHSTKLYLPMKSVEALCQTLSI